MSPIWRRADSNLSFSLEILLAITYNLSITTLRYLPLELRASAGSELTEVYLDRRLSAPML